MMRKMLFSIMSTCAAVLVFIAQTNANSFKWYILYEPGMPKSISKRN